MAEYFWSLDAALNFGGVIDEVKVYDAALSQAEIVEAMEVVIAAVRPADKLTATWGSIKAD